MPKTTSKKMPRRSSQVDDVVANPSSKIPLWPFFVIAGVVVIGIVLFVVLLMSVVSNDGIDYSSLSSNAGIVALVPLQGIISTEVAPTVFGPPTDSSSERILTILEDVRNDPNIDAVLFHINSPGGYVVPSHKIAKSVRGLQVPTVSVVEDVAASGAYMVASETDYIIADDFSMVGSIGVTASGLNFAEFIDEYNVTYQRLVAGEYKDLGSPLKEMTEEERTLFQGQLDLLHEEFIELVAAGRDMTVPELRPLATGQVFLGVQSVENGLVDELGGMQTAEEHLKEMLEVTDIRYVTYDESYSIFDSLLVRGGEDNWLSFVGALHRPVTSFLFLADVVSIR